MNATQLTVEPYEYRRYWVSSSRPDEEDPYLVDLESDEHGGKPACTCIGFTRKRTKRCIHIQAAQAFENNERPK